MALTLAPCIYSSFHSLFNITFYSFHFRLHLIYCWSAISNTNDEIVLTLTHFGVSNLNLIYRCFVNELAANVIEVNFSPCHKSAKLGVSNSFQSNEIKCESFGWKYSK